MAASFYRDTNGVVFFKLTKPPVPGSGLEYVVEVVAEPLHKANYALAWKEFEKSEEAVVEEAPLLIEEAVVEESEEIEE